jgi:AraC-like DNA-binding protein
MKWESKDYDNGIREVILPSGKAFMVFQYAGRFRGTIHDQELFVPKYYTIGQQSSNYTVFSDHKTMGLIGAAFKPTGLHKLFNVDVSTLTNIPTDSTSLFGKDIQSFETLFEAEKKTENRVGLIENLLLGKLGDKEFQDNFVDVSIAMMNTSLGCGPISPIIKKLNVSERYFQKKFKLMVGIAPSAYNRIIRFNNLFSELDANNANDYRILSALYHYYDSSHFRKDFKKYCGEIPKQFHLDKFEFIKEAFVKNPIFLDSIT